MLRLANNFRTLANLANVHNKLYDGTVFIYSNPRWENNSQMILITLQKIQALADLGSYRLYLAYNDTFWKTPEIHDFFTKSGFNIDAHSISWEEENELR